jgi:hypothetical protein
VSAGPLVSIVDTSTVHRRTVAVEAEVKRHWEIPASMSLGAEVLAGVARIDERQSGQSSGFTQGYSEGLVRLSRPLSSDGRTPSRLELTLRRFDDSSDQLRFEEEGVTELSVSWARRTAWGALRLGAGYAW